MNKKISTRTGLLTSMVILAFILFLISIKTAPDSALNLIQFLILFIGIFISIYLLYRYYANISFMEAFLHGLKTLATIVFMVIIGNSILFFIFSGKQEPFSNLTFIIMKTIFAYSVSGVLSSLFSSLIFNTFTKK